jgi:hypothetical protein
VIALLFVWGGFVRSGLGFGGAVLTLPFLLMMRDEPLLFLPIISVHLLLFSGLTVWQAHRADAARGQGVSTVNWDFLRYALPLMIVPKLVGVAGVITLPGSVMSGFIFMHGQRVCRELPAESAVQERQPARRCRLPDDRRLRERRVADRRAAGGARGGQPRAPEQLRDTLFVLWFILVGLKLLAFVITGVDLQWKQHLWLLPCAAIGHVSVCVFTATR